jgi:hypothetical protein
MRAKCYTTICIFVVQVVVQVVQVVVVVVPPPHECYNCSILYNIRRLLYLASPINVISH